MDCEYNDCRILIIIRQMSGVTNSYKLFIAILMILSGAFDTIGVFVLM